MCNPLKIIFWLSLVIGGLSLLAAWVLLYQNNQKLAAGNVMHSQGNLIYN